MSIVNNKQYDSRWGNMPYAGETYTNAGCGPTACSDLIGNTPPTVGSWLTSHGYATNGSGTYWTGIPAGLQAFGIGATQMNYSSLYGVVSNSVFTAFQKHIQSGYCGILLMGKGYWTNGGHYIAVVGYNNGKYQVYDPATTSRDGWHPWSDFQGVIKVCYTTNLKWQSTPTPAPTWKATGTAICTDNRVNFRKEPNGTILGQLSNGQRFEIDGTTSGSWTHAKVDGLGIGYIATQYVKVESKTIPTKLTGYKFTTPTVKMGSTGKAVSLLECILKARSMYSGGIDGTFGSGCLAGVKKQQALRGLTQDGICGVATWTSLIEVPREGTTFYAQTIQKGSQGASVRLAQEILKAYGYYADTIDGIFGNNTKTAITKWQKAKKLTQDGIVGNNTWKSLIGF